MFFCEIAKNFETSFYTEHLCEQLPLKRLTFPYYKSLGCTRRKRLCKIKYRLIEVKIRSCMTEKWYSFPRPFRMN